MHVGKRGASGSIRTRFLPGCAQPGRRTYLLLVLLSRVAFRAARNGPFATLNPSLTQAAARGPDVGGGFRGTTRRGMLRFTRRLHRRIRRDVADTTSSATHRRRLFFPLAFLSAIARVRPGPSRSRDRLRSTRDYGLALFRDLHVLGSLHRSLGTRPERGSRRIWGA